MSQWSKSQDYGNSGSEVTECVRDGDWTTAERGGETQKTIRCVIDKDFESGRLGSGDAGSNHPAMRRENARVVSPATVDSVRLKNHLEWKKQKEAEYSRRREAERMEDERKRDERLRQEREMRRREKEREEKIREWQEQKAREKEERKREEVMMKALEQEIKGVTRTIDKEKLIHEWIRLKNRQKQIEAEKKAELMKREEETRALRQSLAEISYRQWKERTKNRRIVLPKNGYQIFGPKPVPVVKEDWNHDFAKSDTDDRGTTARTPKSTVSMSSIRGSTISRSSYQLNVARSRTTVNDFDGRRSEMILKIPDTEERLRNTNRRLLNDTGKDDGLAGTKNKLDIYLQPRKPKKPEDTLKKYLQCLSEVNSKLLAKLSGSQIVPDRRVSRERISRQTPQTRRSRSYDKPNRKSSGNRSSSASAEAGKTRKLPQRSGKPEGKDRRKGKKACKSEVMDSPYCAKKVRGKGKSVNEC